MSSLKRCIEPSNSCQLSRVSLDLFVRFTTNIAWLLTTLVSERSCLVSDRLFSLLPYAVSLIPPLTQLEHIVGSSRALVRIVNCPIWNRLSFLASPCKVYVCFRGSLWIIGCMLHCSAPKTLSSADCPARSGLPAKAG